MNVASRNASLSSGIHGKLPISSIEQALLKRRLQPASPKSSWERETGRGIQHAFGEYRLDITTASNGKPTHDEIVISEDCSSIATRVWDCAVVTTKWLEQEALKHAQDDERLNLHRALQLSTNNTNPLQVLELGSGMGLLSIAMAKMGAAVLSTEYGSAVAHLQGNCESNGVAMDTATTTISTTLTPGKVLARELDWYKTTETLQTLLPKPKDTPIFDVIAVTDCSLSIKDSVGVLDMIQKYGTPGHTKVLVGLCKEREGTPYFVNAAKEQWKVTEIPTANYHKDFQTKRHTILLIDL